MPNGDLNVNAPVEGDDGTPSSQPGEADLLEAGDTLKTEFNVLGLKSVSFDLPGVILRIPESKEEEKTSEEKEREKREAAEREAAKKAAEEEEKRAAEAKRQAEQEAAKQEAADQAAKEKAYAEYLKQKKEEEEEAKRQAEQEAAKQKAIADQKEKEYAAAVAEQARRARIEEDLQKARKSPPQRSDINLIYNTDGGDSKISDITNIAMPTVANLSLKNFLQIEGLSIQKPEIVAVNQFHSMFKQVEESNSNNEFLKLVADSTNLKSTPAARLMEIQTYVRKLTSNNTSELMQIFSGLSSSLKELVSELVEVNNTTRFLDKVEYDIVTDTFKMSDVVKAAMQGAIGTGIAQKLQDNQNNMYIRMFVRYLIIGNLALRFFEILKSTSSFNENFMSDFYEDVILNAPIEDQEIKELFENRSLTMTDEDHSLRAIVRADLPNSVVLVRIVKALHAACSGFVNHHSSRIYNDDDPGQFYNLVNLSSIKNFMQKSRTLRYEDILYPFRPTNEDFNNIIRNDNNRNEHATVTIDQEVGLTNSRNQAILINLLYDLKNSISLTKKQDSLIAEHLATQQAGLGGDISANNGYLSLTSTEVDVYDFFDGNSEYANPRYDPTGGKSNSLYPNSPVGNLIYAPSSDDTTENNVVMLVDGQNGIIHPDAEGENIVTASEEFFNIANITADNLTQKAQQVRTNVDIILDDIKENYGLRGLTGNAQIPEAYVTGFLEALADELEAGNLKVPSSAQNAPLLQAVLLTRGGESFDFCFDMFVACLGMFHKKTAGLSDKTKSVPVTSIHAHAVPIRDINELIGGITSRDVSSAEFDVRHTQDNGNDGLYPRAKDKLFARYYKDLMPARYLTIGHDGSGESDRFDQMFVDKAYKNRDPTQEKEYDGDGNNTQYLWSNTDNKKHVSVGNDDYNQICKPANATGRKKPFCRHKNFNVTFKNVFNSSRDDASLLLLPFTYDRNFQQAMRQNFSDGTTGDIETLSNIETDDLGNKILVNGIISTDMTRMYVLFKIMCNMFRNAFNFSIQADGLNGENDNDENNKNRQVSINYNGSMIQGAIHALRGGQSVSEDYYDEAAYDNESDPMYKNSYDMVLNYYRQSMLAKIKKTDDRAIILCAALSKLSGYYKQSLDEYTSNFSGDQATEIMQNYLSLLGDSRSIFNFMNTDQLNLATILHKRIMYPSLESYFLPSSKDVTNSQLKCLYKFLSCKTNESQFINTGFVLNPQASSKTRQKKLIFHIGITNSLVRHLRASALDELNFENLSFEQQTEALQKNKNLKIIEVSLYKKDTLNQGSIFLKKYLFDMSKFLIDGIEHPDIKNSHYSLAANNIDYNRFVNSHYIYQTNNDLSISSAKISKIISVSNSEDVEVNLDNNQKKELIGNHMNDYYLKMYCRAMLGLDIDEDIYQFSSVRNRVLTTDADEGSGEIAYQESFVSPMRQTIQLKASDNAYIRERARIESDAQRSVFFSARKYFERTVNPKLFDRVFSVFFDLHELNALMQDHLSIDQFYATVKLTQYQLDLNESKSGPELEQIKDAFEAKHGIHAGLPGGKGRKF